MWGRHGKPQHTSHNTFPQPPDLSQHFSTAPTSPPTLPPIPQSTSPHLTLPFPYPNTLSHTYLSQHFPTPPPTLPHTQGWEKSIFDIDILYFLFIECIGAFTFLNEYRIWPCLYFFWLESIFDNRFFLSRLFYLTSVSLKCLSVCHSFSADIIFLCQNHD